MSFKNIVRELREMTDGIGSMSRRRGVEGKQWRNCTRSHVVPDLPPSESTTEGRWANLPPELLLDIIRRVEESETSWPARTVVVHCASVCKPWRDITKEIVKTPEECGRLTFPISLKQPGPRDSPIQCYIKRDRATSIFRLYFGLTPSEDESDKLLLAAKRTRRATSTEFLISLVADDFSRASSAYVGKLRQVLAAKRSIHVFDKFLRVDYTGGPCGLWFAESNRSNFLGTKFSIYDSQPPNNEAFQANHSRSSRRFHTKQVSPRLPACNYNIATISYELNVLRVRGPRRMNCSLHYIPISSIQEGGTAPTPKSFPQDHLPLSSSPSVKQPSSSGVCNDHLILKNKSPRWHEQLQCWCLNFKGRVTVASVKNFQLVASVGSSHNVSDAEQNKVILQFGKIGQDIFTMDYQYPISAYQAFAICLSSFDTKPACE